MTEVADFHQLDSLTLLTEFRARLQHPDFAPLPETQAVVVLSAPPGNYPDGTAKEHTRENVARIAFGIEMLRHIIAKRTGSSLEDVDFRQGPRLILNGETEQWPSMEAVAVRRLHYPVEMIDIVDCGKRGIGNTKTQFEAMKDDPRFKGLREMVFVTSGYHEPRVERTAEGQLPETIGYKVIPVPFERYPFNIFMIRGEMKRILHYSRTGDIAAFASRRGKEPTN